MSGAAKPLDPAFQQVLDANLPEQKKKKRTICGCDIITIIVALISMAALGFLVHLSRSPSPMLLPNVLDGEWVIEGITGRTKGDTHFNLTHEKAESAANDHLFLTSPIEIMGYTIPQLTTEAVKLVGTAWFWEGSCLKNPATGISSAGKNDGSSSVACTFTYLRHRILFTVTDTQEAEKHQNFVLFRKVPLPPESLFAKKAKYLIAIGILIAGLKFLTSQLNPSENLYKERGFKPRQPGQVRKIPHLPAKRR